MGEIAEAVRAGGGEDAWMDVRSLAKRLEEERIALIMAARSSYDEKERPLADLIKTGEVENPCPCPHVESGAKEKIVFLC